MEEMEQHRKDSHTIEGFSLRLFKDIIKRCNKFRSHWKEILFKSGLVLCFLALFSLSTLAGIFSANVVLDSVALCKSPWCGYWSPIRGLGMTTDSTSMRINKEKQVAAAAQAAGCYRDSSNNNNKCASLISRRVSYTTDLAAPCPLNGDVCVGGADEAFRLDTGYQKAVVLGISSAQPFLFRRITTCAPIIVNDTYARIEDESPNVWRYYYGETGYLNPTFETPIQAPNASSSRYIVA
jgi:hypothetical protein